MLPKSHEQWDRGESFMIKLLDVILDKLGWIRDPSEVKTLQKIKARFY